MYVRASALSPNSQPRLAKPLVMAVNGPCIGEGFTTLMMGDVIYSSDTAYFWAPFARFGVTPG